ncbi:helix-turn-helix transcriptional regulator [Pseudonocardia kunmingensis]|uniref:Putative DNA-binding transcriptional regulator YafY n=1 Tax=Pseudonocardia kunmingensis TaxID=630975 RepID=A0A543DVX3_9PSEU|nr:YafY family protein [Pseudonocardia kunmingensis]TQM13478.1 putative DNA-binding transcriptional regulator YafY [Pseudonocardia kunmingensis]
MANTSSRTLRLLSLLQTHRYWPGAELAARLEVSVRTLRRDIDRLRELGYPVEANRGVDGGYQLAAGAALPPLVLDDEEAVALAVGLQAAAQGGVAGIAESSVRALAKVVQVMPPRLRRRVDALRAMTVPVTWSGDAPRTDPGVLTALAQACRDTERTEFAYAAASGERTERHVEPLRLVSLGRRWYLVAYDLTRHDWRSFRVDRVSAPATTGARFMPRTLPAEDAAAFVRASVVQPPTSWSVEVLLDAPVARVRATVDRWATAEDAGDGRCRLRMRADSLDWPAMIIGSLGADAEVVSPPELLDHLHGWARTFDRASRA